MKKLEELGISPTPWKVNYSDDIDRVVNILDANNKTIVETDYGFYPPELPDARMMTASPKLYAVCLWCLEQAQAIGQSAISGEVNADALAMTMAGIERRCREAIAEAGGEEEQS